MTDQPNNRLTMVFPEFPYFPITRAGSALILIDMQYADAHPDYGLGVKARTAGIEKSFEYYWGAVAGAVEKQKMLLNAARAAGIQVIYTRIATQTGTAKDVGNQHRYVNLAVPKDSVDAQILSDIAPQPDDIVLSKTSSSPFNSTAINQLLRNLKIDTLLVCGVVTNGCVEGTVRDASDLGYNVIMISDASAAVTPELHQAAITNLNNGFCNCRDTETIVHEMEDLA